MAAQLSDDPPALPGRRRRVFRWREMSGVALGGEDALAVVNPIAAAPPIRYEVAIAQLGS